MLGFASIDYAAIECACIYLGAVVVPLQTSAPAAQHAPILAETRPRILAVGIDNLDGLGSRLRRPSTGTAPAPPDRLRLRAPRRRPTRESTKRRCARLAAAGHLVDHRNYSTRSSRAAPRCQPAPMHIAAAGRRPAGLGVLHVGQHRHTQGRDVHRKPVHRHVARTVRSAGHHAELHADEPPDRLRLRHHDAGQRRHQLLRGQERPFDVVRGPGDRTAHVAEPGAAGVRDVLSPLSERAGPPNPCGPRPRRGGERTENGNAGTDPGRPRAGRRMRIRRRCPPKSRCSWKRCSTST